MYRLSRPEFWVGSHISPVRLHVYTIASRSAAVPSQDGEGRQCQAFLALVLHRRPRLESLPLTPPLPSALSDVSHVLSAWPQCPGAPGHCMQQGGVPLEQVDHAVGRGTGVSAGCSTCAGLLGRRLPQAQVAQPAYLLNDVWVALQASNRVDAGNRIEQPAQTTRSMWPASFTPPRRLYHTKKDDVM